VPKSTSDAAQIVALQALCRVQMTRLTPVAAGHIPLHAMRCPPSKARDAHFQGEVAEHGQMGQCAGGREYVLPGFPEQLLIEA
jgi:hypothetical protein